MSRADDLYKMMKDLKGHMNVLLDFWRHSQFSYIERLYDDLANKTDWEIRILQECIQKIKRRRSIHTLLEGLNGEILKLENRKKILNKN